MTLGRRVVLAGLLPLLLAPKTSLSKEAAPARIGWLKIQGPQHTPDQLRAFRNGLRALEQTAARNVDRIMTFRNPTVVTHLRLIAEQSRNRRLPAVFDAREYVEAGGLMSYGPNIDAIYRQLASSVGRLLGGTPSGQIPIEQPTKYEPVVSLATAKALGIAIPETILLRADEVIE